MMSKSKRLHPISIIFHIITTIRQLIVALLPIMVLSLSNDLKWIYPVIGISAFGIVLIGFNILKWLRFTYQIQDDQLRIEQGILIRNKRTISKHRIQSIDLTQNVIHRIFGLTKVQIETAGNNLSVDAALSAVTLQEGQWIHDQLKYHHANNIEGTKKIEDQASIYPTRTISWKKLLLAGSTSGSLGIILALFGFVSSELDSIIPNSIYQTTTNWLLSQAIQTLVILGFVFLIGLWLVGIFSTLLRYGNFTITRYKEELYISRGLLEKKQMTIPLKRIQAIGVKQNLIREIFGLVTVFIEIAGGEVNKQEETETLVYPLLLKREVNQFLREFTPEYDPIPKTFHPLPKRALPYYFIRSLWIPFISIIIVAFFWSEWIWIPIIISIVCFIFGWLRYRTNGYNLTEKHLTLQLRQLSKQTVILKRKRIQAFENKQHFLHQKQYLATLQVSVLSNFSGKVFALKEIEEHEIHAIANWYSYQNNVNSETIR